MLKSASVTTALAAEAGRGGGLLPNKDAVPTASGSSPGSQYCRRLVEETYILLVTK